MASLGNNFSVGNGNQFAGGGNPFAGGSNGFAGGGGNQFVGGGGNPFASAGGNPFASASGNPFAGGGEAKTFNFNGSWDFGTNNPTVSQDNGFMGGNSKPEAVPESTSSIAIAIAGITCLLWSRFKKLKHS